VNFDAESCRSMSGGQRILSNGNELGEVSKPVCSDSFVSPCVPFFLGIEMTCLSVMTALCPTSGKGA
jgi:hypothetical protein